MSFAPKAGCPLCSIVSSAQHTPANSSREPSFPAGSTQPEIRWRDENFTAYIERANPVSSKGHLIIAFNLHVPSIYTLSSTDVALLHNVRSLATRLLTSMLPESTPANSPLALDAPGRPLDKNPQFHIGFITPPFKDTKIPVTDHLHAHAYIGTPDLAGWWRGVAYGGLAWYDIDDLIAEIRESVSNNRVKSGYQNRQAPIDLVANAGARTGTADGRELSEPSLDQVSDIEAGRGFERAPLASASSASSSRSSLNRADTLSPTSAIPPIRV